MAGDNDVPSAMPVDIAPVAVPEDIRPAAVHTPQAPVMSAEQFQAFMAAQAQKTERLIVDIREGGAGRVQTGAGAAVAVGQLQAYALGQDKIKQFTRWSDWLRDPNGLP